MSPSALPNGELPPTGILKLSSRGRFFGGTVLPFTASINSARLSTSVLSRISKTSAFGQPHILRRKVKTPFEWLAVRARLIYRVFNYYPRSLRFYVGLGAEDHTLSRLAGFVALPSYGESSQYDCPSCNAFRPPKEFVPPWQVVSSACAFFYAGFLLFRCRNQRGAIFCAVVFILIGGAMLLVGHERYEDNAPYKSNNPVPEFQNFLHNREIVPQKYLDSQQLLGYSNSSEAAMANVLSTDKKIAVIGALAEGSSIRSIERITGVHRDTIMRLGVSVGQGCTAMMDAKMRNLSCKRLEMDEIWGFVGKKDRNVKMGDSMEVGSVWTYCAIDADTKLVPAFKVGERNPATTQAFVQDVAERMAYRVQISTDGLKSYVAAIDKAFGTEVDYAQIIKIYGNDQVDNRRYSPPSGVKSAQKLIYTGNPDEDLISTSYIERLNATTRLHMRRLTRLTLAFSKKRENFVAAVGLHFAYYNFVKRHNTLRCTPAMAAGVADSTWSVADLVEPQHEPRSTHTTG
jgi:IS1 family transposase